MGKTYDTIDAKLAEFIQKQRMFFVATAALGRDGSVNLSPKGLDSFRILGPRTIVYAERDNNAFSIDGLPGINVQQGGES